MNLFYNLAIGLYQTGARIAAKKNEKIGKMIAGQRSTFDVLERDKEKLNGCIWIHAASLGEFEQGRPLIERIRRENPDERILLTFFSPSGYEVRKNYGEVTTVCYLPFDLEENVKRFLDLVQPRMAIFVKYEFWGNYLQQLKQRGVPTYIISSIFRKGQIFFLPWGGMFRNILKCFSGMYVQDSDSKRLLESIGIKNVVVAGDTRFDRVTDIQASCKRFPILDAFTNGNTKPLLMMGSSWQPDEDIVIPYFNRHPEMRLVIAPHEFNEERIASMLKKITRPVARYTQITSPQDAEKYDCLIIDCFGILSSCYAYAQAAYIGGGFGVGIHNLNEAAVYGIPVIFGPNHYKFKEASDLMACGGGYEITDAKSFDSVFTRLLTSKEKLAQSGRAAGTYIKSKLGATDIIFNQLFKK
ncbi:MAG: 3-deoxy-D-manno-octulosonic acid transferase [Muribaculaceae bacterium]